MAEKILNTRILLKYDSYENWLTNNPILKKGELAIAYLDQEHATEATNFQNIPNVVMKVGDGTSHYKSLKFVSGLAADVYSWAKAPTRPTYEAKDIVGLDTFIADEIQDTNTQYTITKVTDYQYKLQKKELGEEAFSDTGVVIDLPNDTAAITALQNKFTGMTEATVVAHVAAEIAKLGIADYAKKTEVQAVQTELTNYKTTNDAAVKKVGDDLAAYQTTNDAAVQANADALTAIKDHGTVDSFGDVMTEMAKYQLAGDYATKTEAQGYATEAANGKDAAIQAAQDAADAAQAEVDALEQTHAADKLALEGAITAATVEFNKLKAAVGTVPEGSTVIGLVNAAQADADALEVDMGDVDGLSTENKTVVGAINEVLAAVGTGGTAAVVTITTDTTTDGALKSYTIKQGTTTVGVIDIPKDMVVQSGEVVTNPEGQPEGTYIKLVLANATNDEIFVNVGNLVDIYKAQANATQVQLAIDPSTREISATLVAGSVTATELAVNAVTTEKIADANVTKAKLSSAVQASLDKADASATQTDMDAAEGRLDAIEAKLGTGDGSVAAAIATAKQEAIDAAAADAATKAGAAETAAKGYTDAELAKLGDMAYETKANYVLKTEAPGYDDILTKTLAATTYEPIGAQAAAKSYTDEQINGLHAIAKSGSTDDLVAGNETWIFDCGTSAGM